MQTLWNSNTFQCLNNKLFQPKLINISVSKNKKEFLKFHLKRSDGQFEKEEFLVIYLTSLWLLWDGDRKGKGILYSLEELT